MLAVIWTLLSLYHLSSNLGAFPLIFLILDCYFQTARLWIFYSRKKKKKLIELTFTSVYRDSRKDNICLIRLNQRIMRRAKRLRYLQTQYCITNQVSSTLSKFKKNSFMCTETVKKSLIENQILAKGKIFFWQTRDSCLSRCSMYLSAVLRNNFIGAIQTPDSRCCHSNDGQPLNES